jgi:hypothetical protein
MLVAVALGRPWFGMVTRPGRCGGIFLETPRWQLQERLRAISGGEVKSGRVFVQTASDLGMDSIDVCDAGQQDWIIEYIRTRSLDLLVIDPFAFLHGLDENNTGEAKRIGDGLKRIAREGECAIVLLDHYRKGTPGTGDEDVLQKLRGSIAKSAFAGAVMGMDTYHGTLRLRFGKVAARRLPRPIFLKRLNTGALELTEAPVDPKESKAKRKGALEAILDDGKPWKLEGLLEQMAASGHDVTAKTLGGYLNEMIDEGSVRRVKRGIYERKEERGQQ